MSTRATYQLGEQIFYIHHDGYPAGAAGYFANMIGAMTVPAAAGGVDAIEQRAGGAGFAFIRGNMRAEPTEGHEAHGDTEYRWRLEHDGKTFGHALKVQCQARRRELDGWHPWSAPRPIAEFINAHYPGAIVAIEAPDVHWKRQLVATLENAIAIAAAHRRLEAGYAEGNPNRPRHAEHAAAWEREILEQLPARVRWLEKEAAEEAEELAKGQSWGRSYHENRLAALRRELEAIRVPIGELAA